MFSSTHFEHQQEEHLNYAEKVLINIYHQSISESVTVQFIF